MFAALMAWTGGLVFVAALVWSAHAYWVAFRHVPAPWSAGVGWRAVAMDTALFTAFALHHSLFARRRFKAIVERHVSSALERSLYVWVASALLMLVLSWWVPVPGLAWQIERPWSALCHAAQLGGLVLTGYASGRLGVMRLAGIPQATGASSAEQPALLSHGIYGLVRHPIYLAWLLMVWPTPLMTGSRLTFAAVTSVYLAIAVPFEERSLVREFGEAYRAYQRQVRWRMVPFLY
jgi:protein-S-isoprenylcysteine O-methyltransferase Ste14